MKYATKFCIATLVLSMLLAFTVFTLFAGGILVLAPGSILFPLLIGLSCILLAALLIGALTGDYGKMRASFSGCGSLAVLGGTGLILTAFLTSLSPVFAGILFALGMAFCFFFLALLLGGVFSLIYCYFAHGQRTCRNACAAMPPHSVYHGAYEELETQDRRRGGR